MLHKSCFMLHISVFPFIATTTLAQSLLGIPQKFRRLMNKEHDSLEGTLNNISEQQIYLNINHLKNGRYVLRIMFNNKVIMETTFQKTQ